MSESELTALREKLAAAEADIAGKRAVIEASKAAINGQIKDCLKVEDDYANFRAAVAAALAELRAHALRLPTADYSTDGDGAELIKQDAVLKLIDATIAKLDLPEAAPASCTWTLDDDGNYATGCDGLFVILEGTPAENKMAYCCFCGKPVKEQQ